MWADDPEKNKSWLGPWSGLIHCDRCHALMKIYVCLKCGRDFTPAGEWATVVVDGKEHRVPAATFAGALSRTSYSLLWLMKREWERPLAEPDQGWGQGISQRLVIVILFWTLFEHLMDRFFDAALSVVPPAGVRKDLLRRYTTIGSRMGTLYKMLFDSGLETDLASLGHKEVYAHLINVQKCRNEFVHGNAAAIGDALVYDTVAKLPDVQQAWVDLYNDRCTGIPGAPAVWESDLAQMRKG